MSYPTLAFNCIRIVSNVSMMNFDGKIMSKVGASGEFDIPSESDSERLTYQSKWSLVIPLFIGIC